MSMPAIPLQPGMTLQRLLAGIAEAPALRIKGLASDSRKLAAGYAFLACRGASHHGLEFLDAALAARVSAVVWDSDTAAAVPAIAGPAGVPVAGLERHLGEIANRWFDAPSAHLRVSGVTGTNGKTTVAYLLAQCMQRLGKPCGYLGTLGAGIGDLEPRGMTTPACIELHGELAEFVAGSAGHAAIEVSSHALDQNRIDGVRLDSAIFTNLSRDHIDYHGDMAAYGETKARLFSDFDPAHRIVCIDTPFGRELFERCRGRNGGGLVAVSAAPHAAAFTDTAYLFVTATEASERGFAITFDSSWGKGSFRLPLAGYFNVANAVLVLAQLLCWEMPFDGALAALERVHAPAGRMQRVQAGPAAAVPAVYVDYAHTPAGLEAALASLRLHCTGNLWCVFGCGGDRDRGKRPLMGEVAARLADRVVVTSDNPRFEDPGTIIAAILDGMAHHDVAIPDRARAIRYAIEEARDNDVVLVAGKGHENVQVVAGKRLPFSDVEVAVASLAARQPGSGR
ncbi:MAG TPA: UDP-N-acetylmuramoyl-L-alanyl-D-glutamate--2,6-diaminopimelate ligase [Woeseiaceae bacterium]|nr:UDP-N-acetylmuramoyl-L-alanyl-D-glutamate--2,6-diaminopimelate ligase [Woeseiaceae bacterium]